MNYKDKALEIIDRLKFNGYVNNRERGVLRRALLEERPQGKWLFIDNEVGWDKCSNCNWTDTRCHSWNFCPNCGADMRGKEE